MPTSSAPDGDGPDDVDAPLLALREQLVRADAQLEAAALQLRRDADLHAQLSRTTAERDALRRELERLRAAQQPAATSPPGAGTAPAPAPGSTSDPTPVTAPPSPPGRTAPRPARPTPPARAARPARRPTERRPAAARPLPRSRPVLQARAIGAAAVAAVVLGGATAVAGQLRDDPQPPPSAAPTRSGAEPAPSGQATLSGTTGGQAATAPTPSAAATSAAAPARAALSPAAVPSGWKSYRAPDGSYALALPPGWRSAGRHRFVSASGLTVLSVRRGPLPASPTVAERGPLPASPTVADVVRAEKRVAASRPGYRRLAVRVLPFRGVPAAVWDYRYGRGATAQQVSDLALAVDGTGYGLRVQSRESAWRFAAPLRDGLRRSFAAPGLAPR